MSGEGEILDPADLLREVVEVLPVPDPTCGCRKCRIGRRVRTYLRESSSRGASVLPLVSVERDVG